MFYYQKKNYRIKSIPNKNVLNLKNLYCSAASANTSPIALDCTLQHVIILKLNNHLIQGDTAQ